jgi:hypothetical protein
MVVLFFGEDRDPLALDKMAERGLKQRDWAKPAAA